jgi:hypothetical protein
MIAESMSNLTEITKPSSGIISTKPHYQSDFYLIDKLLRTTTTTAETNSTSVREMSSLNGNHGSRLANNNMHESSIITAVVDNNDNTAAADDYEHSFDNISRFKKHHSDSDNEHDDDDDEQQDDLVSETGTYTIDDSAVAVVAAASTTDKNHAKTTDQTVEIVSARAAIDETFGILVIKRPEIDSPPYLDPAAEAAKHAKARMSRQRNKTYSLTKDLLIHNSTTNDQSSTVQPSKINNNNNLSFSASSSSSISSYSNDSKQQFLKKTATYQVISDSSTEKLNEIANQSEITNPLTSRTVRTDFLLGDTEQLMDELKKKKQRTVNISKILTNLNIENQSSSTSSSSTNLSNEAAAVAAAAAKSSQTWTIPVAEIESSLVNDALSTRATVDFDMDASFASGGGQQSHRGGMAFDIPAAGGEVGEAGNGTNVCLSAAAIQKLTGGGPVRSSSVAAYRSRIDKLNRSRNESGKDGDQASEISASGDTTVLDSNR